jgi:hypothetical protein
MPASYEDRHARNLRPSIAPWRVAAKGRAGRDQTRWITADRATRTEV